MLIIYTLGGYIYMNKLKDIIFICSSLFASLTLVTYFLRNSAYYLIDKNLGIKKSSKSDVITEIFMKLINYTLALFILLLFNTFKPKYSKSIDVKDLLNSLIPYIIIIVYWVIIYFRIKFICKETNKYLNNYNYSVSNFNLSIIKNKFIIFIIIDIIMSSIGFSLYIYDCNKITLVLYLIFIYYLTLIWYGYEEVLSKINNIKSVKLYCVNSSISKTCKIIKSNTTYTIILIPMFNNCAKLEYIKNDNILYISEIK